EEFHEPPHRGNRGGRRRRDNEVDRDLGSIKLNIPTFKGRSDPEAYLEPISTWAEMKSIMRKRFVPSHYFRDLYRKLQTMSQGTKTVDEYFKEMEIAMIRANVDEDREATMARFLSGLNRDIANIVELQHHIELEDKVHTTMKVERQLRTKVSFQRSFSSNLYPSSKAKEGSPKINFGAASKTQNETSNTKGHMVDKGKAVASSSRSPDIKCFRCQGFGHIASECINKRFMILRENGVPRRPHLKMEEAEQQRENIFHMRCLVLGKVCMLIVDGGSCANVASCEMVEKLNLPTTKHTNPYKLQWLNDCGEIRVTKQVLMSFSIGNYKDEVLCDVVPMHASHILLGRPWKFERRVTYDGFLNRYSLKHENRSIQLVSLNPQQ
ncbi:Unknown protein, partial [Striga hermonthica]